MIHSFCDYKGSYALRSSTATVTLPVSRNHKHRHVIDARRPIQYGGGACNLLLLNGDEHVELLFHATPQTGAVMTPAQAAELAQALTTLANHQTTAPKRPGKPEPRLVRQPTNCCSRPGDALDAVGSDRVDKRKWGIAFAGHLTAVSSQQVITNPTLLARGNIAQEGPRAAIARGITKVLGKLIMHALASLDAGIARAAAQGNSVSREPMPATGIPGRITDPTSNDRGRPHPWILRRWRHRLRTRRYHRDYRGDGRNQRPTSHPGASARHNKTPLCNVAQPPSTHD
jgi:hypothetical protein